MAGAVLANDILLPGRCIGGVRFFGHYGVTTRTTRTTHPRRPRSPQTGGAAKRRQRGDHAGVFPTPDPSSRCGPPQTAQSTPSTTSVHNRLDRPTLQRQNRRTGNSGDQGRIGITGHRSSSRGVRPSGVRFSYASRSQRLVPTRSPRRRFSASTPSDTRCWEHRSRWRASSS